MLTESDLHHYQHYAINAILDKKRCMLAQEMGLGKTISALTAFTKVLNVEVKKCLIISPLNVAKTTWINEIANWEHTKSLRVSLAVGHEVKRQAALEDKEADVYIINQENVPWLFEKGYRKYGFIIVDESSGFKSHSSNRFKALKHFICKYMLLLTGTPMPNGFMDLWSQYYLIDRGERLGKYITHYRNSYFSYDEYKRKYLCLYPKTIIDRLADITITMKAADYLELPDRIDNYVPVEIDNKEIYDEFAKEYIVKINDAELSAVNSGVLYSKLLQYCNGAVYSSENDGTYTITHNNKIDYLKEFIELYPDENILVAYKFNSDLERIQKAIPESVSLTRKNVIEVRDMWNSGKIKVLLCQCGTAKGLNLQHGGRIIVWFGLTPDLEHYQQFNARLHRQGQTKPVLVYHIVAKGCKDEEVVKILSLKNINQEMIYQILKKS